MGKKPRLITDIATVVSRIETTKLRVRKAWAVRIKGYDSHGLYYGPSAGKVRAQVWRGLYDGCTKSMDITVRRSPFQDVLLPARDPLAEALSKEETHCLLHAFGGDGDPIRAGYRDYFYTRRDDPPLVSLTAHGLMSPMDGDMFGENMTYFVLTAKGKQVALSLTPEYAR